MRIQLQINFSSGTSASNFTASDAPVPTQSNVSDIDTFYKSNRATGFKGFQLSDSSDKPVATLDGTYKLFDKYPGYLSKILSGADGVFLGYVHIPIIILGNVPDVLYIGFDIVAREYAEEFVISGNETGKSVTIKNNVSPVVAVKLQDLGYESSATYAFITLQIRKWSKPNASIKLTMCTSSYSAIFNTHELHEITASRNSRETQLGITPGIITQYFDGVIYDRYNILHNFALQDLLQKKLEIVTRIIDDATNTTYLLGNYIITDWDVNIISSQIDIAGSDTSINFENIQVEALSIKERTLHTLLEIAFNYAKVPWKYADTYTANNCACCVIPDSWHTACNLREFLEDICTLGMLNIYWDKNTFVVGGCY